MATELGVEEAVRRARAALVEAEAELGATRNREPDFDQLIRRRAGRVEVDYNNGEEER
jgi:hypothetical protein